MSWAMVAVAGASLAAGAMGASASKSAANAQAGAANNATQAQKDMFDTQVGMETPFRQAGVNATQRLSYLLGLPDPNSSNTSTMTTTPGVGTGTISAPATGAAAETVDQIRARLTPQFTTQAGAIQPGAPNANSGWSLASMGGSPGGMESPQFVGTQGASGSSVDSAGLDAAVQAEIQKQQAAQAQGTPAPAYGPTPGSPSLPGTGAQSTDQSTDPQFGSLLHNFGTADFQLDPGIQFQTEQGNKALINSQAAGNGVLTGSALKDLMAYNQQMAGTGYQSAFDRYMANKGFTMSALSGMGTTGQAAASNQATGGSAYASGIAGSMQGAGNAQAAGAIGSANALSGGVSGAGNAYLLRNLLSSGGGSSAPSSFGSSPMSGLLYSNGSLGD